MEKHGPGAIKEFTLAAYSEFGMRIAVLAAFVDGHGEPAMSM